MSKLLLFQAICKAADVTENDLFILCEKLKNYFFQILDIARVPNCSDVQSKLQNPRFPYIFCIPPPSEIQYNTEGEGVLPE